MIDAQVTETVGSSATVAVIIVGYNSGPVIPRCLDALATQTRRPDTIVLVDNNSPDAYYLAKIPENHRVKVVRNRVNEGFCAANNTGFRLAGQHKYVLFLNPDAFLSVDFVERALEWMECRENSDVGVLTGTLLGFDIGLNRQTGLIDSTGIFQTRYGKWYDRGQGEAWPGAPSSATPEEVPAIVGALMFCRSLALATIRLPSGDIFDSRFFMYKEDIDLSLRLKKRGWRLIYCPTLVCEHCRGWKGRREMSAHARFLSARNELWVCFENGGKGFVYSGLKFLFVPAESIYLKLLKTLKK
jgi:N-acetylglucosaminyl-diphospho-decaprenol L-rhamnosyltransferase